MNSQTIENDYQEGFDTHSLSEKAINVNSIKLSSGETLEFQGNKEFSWGDYEIYEDLGSGLKAEVNPDTRQMEVDLGSAAKSTRSQKVFLIKFYWNAEHVNFGKLKIQEIVALLKPIQKMGFLEELREALKV